MAVKSRELDNQERDIDLVTRKERKRPRAREETASFKPDDESTAERRAFQERLQQARILKPPGLHWWECWRQGRDTAIAACEAEGDTSRAATIPPPAVIGCADCFRKGRDAAVHLIESG